MVPGITQLVGTIPLMDVTAIFRYAPPSWGLAATILAAFALDAWQRHGAIGRQAIGVALLTVLGALGLALAAASGIVAGLWQVTPPTAPGRCCRSPGRRQCSWRCNGCCGAGRHGAAAAGGAACP
ncbi:hypothetical protein [Dankookia sp. P2]|uniref:hypothetical protein n=1 Tax=Dankookia sp. P2 TaxID=3423955 RepID=UPI003D668E4E